MVRFLLLRHGKSVNNGEKRYSGQFDTPLSETGHLQARQVAEFLLAKEKIHTIYSSDLSRAMDTARPTAAAFGLEIIPRKDLREIDVGIFQNRLYDEIQAEYPAEREGYRFRNQRIPGGDCYGDVAERGWKALKEIAPHHEGQTVLVSTHGAMIRCLFCLWNGLDFSQVNVIDEVKNASLTEVFFEDGAVRLGFVGSVEHLK